ncbi:protein root UVB sensitive 4-like isoform X2 [Magnolia sinica]|uniref:protein root UVB sensitive 4-like isoform X2 n=1 Tax=Magnolia sinica TaxID=86752 RepID=UPI0026583F37|nr:protein root UVB sensitive 4-like isoform X2 [Magnolia sinica]
MVHCQLLRPGIGRRDCRKHLSYIFSRLIFLLILCHLEPNCTRRWLMLRIFNLLCAIMELEWLRRVAPGEVVEKTVEKRQKRMIKNKESAARSGARKQAMFRAIGIGSSRSLPLATALNWVLKDGLGLLSRCIYTASLGSAFDANLKRVRFSISILFSLSIGVELLTPMFPQYFLLLATIANILKSISLAAYLATGEEASYEQEAIYQYEDEEDDDLDDEAYFGSSSSFHIDAFRQSNKL